MFGRVGMDFPGPLEIGSIVVSVVTAMCPSKINQKEIFVLPLYCNTNFRKAVIE
jgi:hypothetical protein